VRMLEVVYPRRVNCSRYAIHRSTLSVEMLVRVRKQLEKRC
jgi:hypothetical protein